MDVIDTTLRVGSREKLHPKHGYDEEVGTQLAVAVKLHSEKLAVEKMCNIFCWHNPPATIGGAAEFCKPVFFYTALPVFAGGSCLQRIRHISSTANFSLCTVTGCVGSAVCS